MITIIGLLLVMMIEGSPVLKITKIAKTESTTETRLKAYLAYYVLTSSDTFVGHSYVF